MDLVASLTLLSLSLLLCVFLCFPLTRILCLLQCVHKARSNHWQVMICVYLALPTRLPHTEGRPNADAITASTALSKIQSGLLVHVSSKRGENEEAVRNERRKEEEKRGESETGEEARERNV